MKKLALIVTAITIAITLYGQNHITRFLDIPVDGPKKEFVKSLKKKGFKKDKYDKEAYEGMFNGEHVGVKIVEKDNIVKRIAVIPTYGSSARQVKIDWNNLCRQFLRKDNYISVGSNLVPPTYTDIAIPIEEDIEYELLFNGKKYQAAFIQLPAPKDSIIQQMEPSHVAISFQDTEGNAIDIHTYTKLVVDYFDNSVWFTIQEQNGKYFIVLFYDNNYEASENDDL